MSAYACIAHVLIRRTWIVSFDMRIAFGHLCKALEEVCAVYFGVIVKLLTVKLPHFYSNVMLSVQVFDDGMDSFQEREQIESADCSISDGLVVIRQCVDERVGLIFVLSSK